MLINLNDYEKAIVVLALRQYTISQYQKAVASAESGENYNDAMARGADSNSIADRIEQIGIPRQE